MTRSRASLLLLCFDFAATALVFNAMLLARNIPSLPRWLLEPLLVPYLVTVGALYLVDGYRLRTDFLSADYTSEHALALTGAQIATLLMTFVVAPLPNELTSSRLLIGLSFLALIPVTLAYRRALRLRFLAQLGEQTLVFAGDAPSRRAFYDECVRMGEHQPVVYAHPRRDAAESDQDLTTINIETLLAALEKDQRHIAALIVHEQSAQLPEATARRILALNLRGIRSHTLQHFYEVHWRRIPLAHLNSAWIFDHGFEIAREPMTERLKRVSDLFFSSVGLVVGTPIVVLGALAIWLEDGKWPFFIQSRIGRNGVPFRIMKLRTMRASAGDPYTAKNDARITRVGRFLRKSRLDEIPQLWNVLKGEMSLIGPRCEWDQLVAHYEREIPYYHFRHMVKPGITGWAQVNFPYGASLDDARRKLEYDLYYIRNFSFVLDASIAIKTVHTMLFGRGT